MVELIPVARELDVEVQRHRRLLGFLAERRRRLAPPLLRARQNAARHQVFEAGARRFDRFGDGLKPVGTRHLDAGDKARLHGSRAKNLHRVAHPAHPVVPPDALRLSRIDPFEEPPIPHLHIEVDVVDAGGFVARDFFSRPRIDLEGNPWL